MPTYDLRFEHMQTAGVIWLSSVPVSTYDGGKELRVLMQDYVDSVAGAGYEVARIGRGRMVVSRRYAAQVVELLPGRLAGCDALGAVIDVANVDQLQMTPGSRRMRVKLVIVRAGLTHEHGTTRFPVFLVAGYANQPDFFARDLADFTSLLGRITLRGQTGYAEQAPSQATDAGAAGPHS
jgi:hypothetical protein